jgi:hypothetical protein
MASWPSGANCSPGFGMAWARAFEKHKTVASAHAANRTSFSGAFMFSPSAGK